MGKRSTVVGDARPPTACEGAYLSVYPDGSAYLLFPDPNLEEGEPTADHGVRVRDANPNDAYTTGKQRRQREHRRSSAG